MSFLNKKMSWTNAEFIPFKVSIASAYLYLGSTFSEFFLTYKGFILGLFAASLVYVMMLWVKKMRS